MHQLHWHDFFGHCRTFPTMCCERTAVRRENSPVGIGSHILSGCRRYCSSLPARIICTRDTNPSHILLAIAPGILLWSESCWQDWVGSWPITPAMSMHLLFRDFDMPTASWSRFKIATCIPSWKSQQNDGLSHYWNLSADWHNLILADVSGSWCPSTTWRLRFAPPHVFIPVADQ